MQHLWTDTGSSGPHWGDKEHTASVHVPPMARTKAPHGLEIPISEGNPASHVQADGNDNM